MPEIKVGTVVPSGQGANTVKLPCGYLHTDGKVYNDADVGPMLGMTLKAIARDDVRNNSSRVTDTILKQCVTRIGPVQPVGVDLVRSLLVGDRDFLVIEARRATKGSRVIGDAECGKCGKKLYGVSFSLDEMKVKRLDPGAYEIRDGKMVFRMSCLEPRVEAVFRYPDGSDQAAMAQRVEANPIDALGHMYTRCMVDWSGDKGSFGDDFFDGMSATVLEAVIAEFEEHRVGPVMTIPLRCPKCEEQIDVDLSASDFLFRPSARGTR